MLTISQISKSYGGRTLFRDVSLQVNRGETIGLVGPNGAGKSTLFSLILRENLPDEGSVLLERGATLGFLPQESAPVGEETVLALATSHLSGGNDDDEADRFALQPKAKRILRGLAFREEQFEAPARTLSGGWVMRAHLARLLVQEPDLLLLDEPTNHLDLETLRWFQDYLKTVYPGAILAISHDREFLNTLCESIVEIASGQLHRYRGNYENYLEQRAARREQQLAAYKAQQREIESLQRFADRFRAKASKASQAQSKLKQIARMERIEAPEAEGATVKFRFPQPPRSGHKVIELKDVTQAYGDKVIYRGLNLAAERGERTVLVGPNGAGKSTLLKILAGVLPIQAGAREEGLNAKVGYFAQHRVEMLHPRHTVLQAVLDAPKPVPEQTARTVLGSFLFRGDDAFKPVSVLSGGEKSRLALVKLLLDPPNLLLMDEPTTHLDMASIDALVGALAQYEGTLVFISHDVHFIRQLAGKVLHVDAGRLTPYAGGYDYYLEKSRHLTGGVEDERAALVAAVTGNHHRQPPVFDRQPNNVPTPPVSATVSVPAPAAAPIFKTKEQKRAEAEARQAAARARREEERRVAELEREIAELETRQRALTAELEDEATYAQPGRALEVNRELTAVTEALERLTAEWEFLAATVATLPA